MHPRLRLRRPEPLLLTMPSCEFPLPYNLVDLSLFLDKNGSATTTAVTTTTGTVALPTGTSTAKSNTVAKTLGGKKYFGSYVILYLQSSMDSDVHSATDNPEFNDTAYVATLSDNTLFGQITPGNSMKWVRLRVSRLGIVLTFSTVGRDRTKSRRFYLRCRACV